MAEAAEIEITPEMVCAGREMFRHFVPDAEEAMANSASGAFVMAVYRAMLEVKRGA